MKLICAIYKFQKSTISCRTSAIVDMNVILLLNLTIYDFLILSVFSKANAKFKRILFKMSGSIFIQEISAKDNRVVIKQ